MILERQITKIQIIKGNLFQALFQSRKNREEKEIALLQNQMEEQVDLGNLMGAQEIFEQLIAIVGVH